MEKRITKRDNYEAIRTIVAELGREDLVDFVNYELEQLAKRAAHNTLTKTQKENIELVEVIYDAIVNAENPVTVTEIFEAVKNDKIASSQKVSALVKKLVDAGRVVKVVEKNKAYFSIAE